MTLWSDSSTRDASKGLLSALICLGLVIWWLLGCPESPDDGVPEPLPSDPHVFAEVPGGPPMTFDHCIELCAVYGGVRYMIERNCVCIE